MPINFLRIVEREKEEFWNHKSAQHFRSSGTLNPPGKMK